MAVDEHDELPESTPEKTSFKGRWTASKSNNKKHLFQTRVRSMPTFETPNSGEDAIHPRTVLNENEANWDEARNTQIHNMESNSESEPDQDAPEGAAAAKFSWTSYLEQMFSKKFDAIQSMVERLPGVAPPIRKSGPDYYADTPFAIRSH
ncbi:hypothetical protein Bca4012_037685 [Brassica carinata]